ncbi:MAG: tetratricopeptide repeat protein [Verrucomicrobiales bacterium]
MPQSSPIFLPSSSLLYLVKIAKIASLGTLLLFVGLPTPATADPSDEFLRAFLLTQEADQLDSEGQLRPAYERYREAMAILQGIIEADPTWQPTIVEYRTRRTAESLSRLQDRLGALLELPEPEIPATQPTVEATPPPEMTPVQPTMEAPPITPPSLSSVPSDTDDLLAQVQARMRALQEQLALSEQSRRDLEERLRLSADQTRQLAQEVQRLREVEDGLRLRLTTAEERAQAAEQAASTAAVSMRQEIEQLKEQLATAEDQRKKATELADALGAQLEEATGERNTAIAELDRLKAAEEKFETTLSENEALREQLEALSEPASQLAKKDEEIEELREQAAAMRVQLENSRQQNVDYESAIRELQAQLDRSSSQLVQYRMQGISPDDLEQLTAENRLLRSVVERQISSQSRREQAQRLIIEELDRLEIQSQTISDNLRVLSPGMVDLSDDEREQLANLFRAPTVTTSDAFGEVDLEIATEAMVPDGATIVETTEQPRVESQDPQALPAQQAREFIQQGLYGEAEKIYDDLLAQDPEDVFALSNQAVVYFHTDRVKPAEMLLLKALEKEPDDAFSHQTLGIVYYRMERFDEAIAALTRSLDIEPNNPVAHNYLGITASQQGWTEAAEKEILEAVALDPNYSDAHFNLAVLYSLNQPPAIELARRHYQRAVELGAAPDSYLEGLLQE